MVVVVVVVAAAGVCAICLSDLGLAQCGWGQLRLSQTQIALM